jgi:cytochrome c biogenesis protein CcdA/glutaredoxin-related protein
MNSVASGDSTSLTISDDNVQNLNYIGTRSSGYENISFAFFYDPGCECTKAALPEMKKLEEAYPEVNQVWYNLTFIENKSKLIDFQYVDAYNLLPDITDDTPFVFIGDYYFHGYGVTFENVSEVIELYKGREVPLWDVWELAWTMHVAFFYDPVAEITDGILDDVQSVNTTWNQDFRHVIVHYYSLDNQTNGLLLNGYFLEFNLSDNSPFKDPSDIIACVFIGDDFLLNSDINYSSLNSTVTKYSGENTPLPDIRIDLTGGKICLIIFYSSSCGECHQARKILEKMKGKYSELDVREYNIADSDNEILKQSYMEYYNVSSSGSLAVFIGDRYFVTTKSLAKDIEDVINDKIDGCPCPEVEADKEIVIKRFTGFTILAVMAAGLVDGINPCAFATLIFFILYLSKTGRTKKQVLVIGIAYTLGIFITYMALGLGLYALIAKSGSEYETISKLLYPIIGILSFILGFYSLYDYSKARKGKKEEMKLQLPTSIKKLVGRVIKHHVQLKYFAIIAIITGVLIALFEFLCTGQVYLPTIMVIVAEVPEYQTLGVLYLFLYNIMFILPLIIIFGAVYFGMSSEQLQDVLDQQRANIKLFFALLFFGLGTFLLWYSWAFIF